MVKLGINLNLYHVKRARIDPVMNDDEIKRFEAFPRVGENIDILAWWKSMSLQFPGLAKVAREYLAIPGSSASSERAFSAGGNMITKKRASLATSTVQAAQCLRSWFKVADVLGLDQLKRFTLKKSDAIEEFVNCMSLDQVVDDYLSGNTTTLPGESAPPSPAGSET